MAQNLVLNILAKDKTRQAFAGVRSGLANLKSAVFSVQSALVGIGGGLVVKSILDVGSNVEQLRLRFAFLFKGVKEGDKAFKGLIDFASRVPFTLEEIQAGAGNLAVVTKNADELNEILQLTGNIASVTGLDFRTTAEQIQRAFSSGIGSADLFRERGIGALLGFKSGAKVSVEETVQAFEQAFGSGGRFDGATDDLAETFTGTLSMIGDKFFAFQKTVAEAFFVGLKKEFGALDDALADNEDVIQKVAKAVGKGLSDAVIMAGNAVKFLHDNFETIKALAIGVVVFKISKSFLALALSVRKVGLAMLAMSKISKTTVIGILLALGVTIAELTGATDKFFKMFEKPKSLEDFKAEMEVVIAELQTFSNKTDEAFQSFVGTEVKSLINDLESMRSRVAENSQEYSVLTHMLNQIRDAVFQVPLEEMNVKLRGQTEEVGMLTKAYESFSKGFMEAVNGQKSGFKQIEDIGKQSFGKLKQTLTDFVITGKLNIGDLGKFVVRSFVEMLVGEAVKMAFAKSSAMFKADAIAKGTASVFQGALKTFAEIPFPLNLVAVGGAIAFGTSLLNKIKGFEKGGRPPVGQPSIVGEKGAELFVPDQAGTIVPNDKLGMGQPVTVNFNINTVDARGFNELLVNSRGVIVNMINQAVNEKGRMAII